MRLTGVTVLLVLSLVLYACNCHVHTSPAHHHDDDTLPPHRCIHNEIANSPKIREAQQKPALFENHEELMRKRSLLKQEATFQPMRFQFVTESIDLDDRETACYNLGDTIKVGDPISRNVVCSSTVVNNCWFTCTANALITPQKKEALVLLINKLKVEFESLLLTRRLAGNVKLPLDPCQGVPVPKSLNSTLYASKADMLVFVTMRAKQGTLGYAYHCMRETIYGRPVVGMLNINPQYIGASSGVYDTCKHELVHALAFSPFLYPYFIDAAGNRYQKVFSTETRYFRDSSGTNQQKSVSKLVTPKLTAQVREHFNCSSIDGAELEEAGSSSSAAAHFEARIFMNELMIASNGYEMYGAGGAAFSQFTFAVLEDSGWYQIANWTKVEPLLFGRKAGCTMVNDRCEDWKTKREGHFCDKRNWSDGSSILRCNYDLTTKGSCDIVTYTANLNYYEHLSDPRQGGSQEFFDRCPLVARDSRYDCRVSTSDKKISGEVWGPGSACFSSNAVTSLTGTLNQRSIDARCFQFSCNNTRLSVKMGDTLIPCPRDQSYLRITALPDGYSGYIECPESGYDILCGVGSVAQSNEVIVTPDNSNDTSTSWWCRNLGIFCGSGNSAATHSRSLVTASAIVGGAFILAQIAA